jgi:hypothetical protein
MRTSQGNTGEYSGPDSHVRIRVPRDRKRRERAAASALDQFTHHFDAMNDAILNTALVRNLRAATITPSISESRHGARRPQVAVTLPRGTSPRKTSAVLHTVAAVLELATSPTDRWCVVVDHVADHTGCVYVELADDTFAEADRALAMIRGALA